MYRCQRITSQDMLFRLLLHSAENAFQRHFNLAAALYKDARSPRAFRGFAGDVHGPDHRRGSGGLQEQGPHWL